MLEDEVYLEKNAARNNGYTAVYSHLLYPLRFGSIFTSHGLTPYAGMIHTSQSFHFNKPLVANR